jgi:hypoxanthine phosphoribosyltransferase
MMAEPTVVRLTDLPALAGRICDALSARGISVGHVVYIETGGRLIGVEIARQLDCASSPIFSTRRGSKVKRLLSPALGLLPTRVAHELRRLELGSGMHRTASDRQVSLPSPLPAFDGALLVVDDAVDTGHSIRSVVEFLSERGVAMSRITTAAVTVTGRTLVHAPDVQLYSHLITFPWSPGSPDDRRWRELVRQSA